MSADWKNKNWYKLNFQTHPEGKAIRNTHTVTRFYIKKIRIKISSEKNTWINLLLTIFNDTSFLQRSTQKKWKCFFFVMFFLSLTIFKISST